MIKSAFIFSVKSVWTIFPELTENTRWQLVSSDHSFTHDEEDVCPCVSWFGGLWDNNGELLETFCSDTWLTAAVSNQQAFELIHRLWLVEVQSGCSLSISVGNVFLVLCGGRVTLVRECWMDGWSQVWFCVQCITSIYLLLVVCDLCRFEAQWI